MCIDSEKNIVSKELYHLFDKLKSRRFVFVKPGGNWGDDLIYRGAEKIAGHCNIDYVSVDYNEFMSSNFSTEDVIYIHGCGGVNRYGSKKAIDLMLRAVNHYSGYVIIGPHTCEADIDFLIIELMERFDKERLDNKKYFFAREMTTFNLYKKILPDSVKLLYDHDTALNLTKSDLKIETTIKGYNAFFIRYDKEASVDKNFKYFGLCIDPASYCKSFNQWLQVHVNAKCIITNRTHSSILGYILNKDVFMLPNIYHKNRSIWEYSLKNKGVKWSDDVPVQNFQKLILELNIMQKFLNSWKVQNLIVTKYYGV